MDDFLTSLDSPTDAVRITKDAVGICDYGGFLLTKWTSNSPEVMKVVSSSEGLTSEIDLNMDDHPSSRVLGIHWLVKNDRLTFKASAKSVTTMTKRTLLSLLCSLFDPLGFLSPFAVRGRVLIQYLWSTNVGWDEEIDEKSVTLSQLDRRNVPDLRFFSSPKILGSE
jgi:hypothetical protein